MRAIRSIPLMFGPLAALGLAATPASAQESDEAEVVVAEDLSETLRDPQVQATATATVAILGEVLLDMPVGPLVEAMDEAVDKLARETGTETPPRKDVDPDATLRDMLGPDGDRVSVELAERVPQAMDAAAGMTGAIEAALPKLKEAAERMKRSLPARLPVLSRD